MFKKLFHKLKSAFTLKHACMLLLPVLMVILLPDVAHAATPEQTEVYTKIGSVLSIVLNIVQSLLWPFLLFIGDLMDVDMITGPGMEERLWAIWVQMRDLVNICFVIFLLVIAFYNTLGIGGGEGNLAMKTALPKVVLGLILVNFTFVGGKLIIDVSNVATTAVFALPELVEDFDMDSQRDDLAKNMCSNKEGANYAYDSEDTPVLTRIFCKVNEEETEYLPELSVKSEQQYFIRMNKSNIALVMATNMGAVTSQLELDTNITSLGELIENLGFSVIMSLVFAIAYIALGLVLLARVVVLWLVLAFSPIGVLIFVIPQLKDLLGGGGDLMQKIVKHLMAPIVIGIALTVGYLMIEAYDGIIKETASLGGAEADALLATEVLFSGVSDIAQLIIAVASVVVVWVGVFSASSDTLAGFATNGIKGLGEMAGKQIAQLPLQAASMPIPVFNSDTQKVESSRISGLDMIQAAKNGLGNFKASKREDQNNRIVRTFGKGFGNQGGRFNSAKDKLTDLNTSLTSNAELTNSELDRIKREFSQIAQNNNVSNPGDLQRQLNAEVEKVKSGGSVDRLASWIRNNADDYGIKDKDDKDALSKMLGTLGGQSYKAPEKEGNTTPAAGGGSTQVNVEVDPNANADATADTSNAATVTTPTTAPTEPAAQASPATTTTTDTTTPDAADPPAEPAEEEDPQ